MEPLHPASQPGVASSFAGDAREPGAANAAQPAWFGAAALAFALLAIAWFFALLVRDVEAADFTVVDTACVRLDAGPGWVDPRWPDVVRARVARMPGLRADDERSLACVAEALLELPFVAEVGRARVVWPDGLELGVKLREPVACVRVGEQFLTVAADGIVLTGAWSVPPARDTGFLPVVALDDAARGEVFEGGLLSSTNALDGMAIAESMWRTLPAEDLARLGRIVIDARAARRATVEEPGTVLWLESGRRVLFGRSPNLDAPGELPIAHKWASLSRAVRLLDGGSAEHDWEMVDVRWDRPELLPRGGVAREIGAR